MKKKFLIAAMVIASLCVFAACGKKDSDKKEDDKSESTTQATTQATEADAVEEDEENYETGDASLDDPRNADEIGEKEILVVSFGTSFNDSRRLTIGGIEEAIEKANPDWSVRRAFTAQIIIDHVKKRDGEVIDNVKEALDRAVANGVKTLVIQPTHLMHGYEYDDVVAEVAGYADQFENLVVAEPLLTTDEDFEKVANVIAKDTASYDNGETAICFMGHGTEHESNAVYVKMQETLKKLGYNNYYVGTVEAEPSFQDVIDDVKAAGTYKKAVLKPLMVVAGDHANNDMAGDEEDSWKSMFISEGFEVEAVVTGLGQIKEIQDIYVEHTKAAIDSLNK